MKFLSTLNWPRIMLVGLAVLALIALIVGGIHGCKKIEADEDAALVNSGETLERSRSQGEVLNDVHEARNAVSNPSSDDLNRVCSKYDRNCTPSN